MIGGQRLSVVALQEQAADQKVARALKANQASFSETLSQAVQDVSKLQQEASKAVEQIVRGEPVDLHEVMIAVEKAKTSFDLLMEIRNKTLDMYREMMRLQV
jgi:flagellar hook-basal body complex protein FliE